MHFLDPATLIRTYGTIGVLAIVFAETGLLIGFILPGDSLLFLAGIAASPVAAAIVGTSLPLPVLLIGAPVSAILGAQLGHFLGARYGIKLFQRPNSRLFKAEYADRARHYFDRYGPPKAIVIARFLPVVRTFLNPVTGMLGLSPRRFLLWNVVGGVLWTDLVLLAGYLPARALRDTIGAANIDTYLLPVTVAIVLVSFIPIALEIRRARRDRSPALPGPTESGR
jgi:membrane-associated protein